jgi:hypothetical protein
MDNSLKTILPAPAPPRPRARGIVDYNLPIAYQRVLDGDCSGLYCFKHKMGV